METEKEMEPDAGGSRTIGRASPPLSTPLTHRPSAEDAQLGAGRSFSGQTVHSPSDLAPPEPGR